MRDIDNVQADWVGKCKEDYLHSLCNDDEDYNEDECADECPYVPQISNEEVF